MGPRGGQQAAQAVGGLTGGVQGALGLDGGGSLPVVVAQLRGGADLHAGWAGPELHGGLGMVCCSVKLGALSFLGPSRGRGRLGKGLGRPGIQMGPWASSSDGLVWVGCTVHAGLRLKWVGGIPMWGHGSLLGSRSHLQLPHQSSIGGLHRG